MNEEALTKLTRARISLIVRQPFFGELAMRLKLVEDSTLDPKTLAVDGRSIFYHPDWVLDNDDPVVMSGIAHEVMHVVLEHIPRRRERDPTRWNHAGDYVGNAILKDAGFDIPSSWLYDPKYKGLTTDEVYNMLPPIPPNGSGSGSGQFDKHFTRMPDDIDPEFHADEWKLATTQAANAAKQAGNLPGSLERFIDEITRPKPDWRAYMRRFFNAHARDDYSFARMNRKFMAMGLYLPGLYSERMGTFVGTIDTSGSISKPVFDAFVAELAELRQQLKPEAVHIIQCDSEISSVHCFEEYDDFKFPSTGGGGTDFRPPFRYVEEQHIAPKCFVYLTDGYGPFPKVAPPYPVLWLMTTDVIPPWGEHVRIEV